MYSATGIVKVNLTEQSVATINKKCEKPGDPLLDFKINISLENDTWDLSLYALDSVAIISKAMRMQIRFMSIRNYECINNCTNCLNCIPISGDLPIPRLMRKPIYISYMCTFCDYYYCYCH